MQEIVFIDFENFFVPLSKANLGNSVNSKDTYTLTEDIITAATQYCQNQGMLPVFVIYAKNRASRYHNMNPQHYMVTRTDKGAVFVYLQKLQGNLDLRGESNETDDVILLLLYKFFKNKTNVTIFSGDNFEWTNLGDIRNKKREPTKQFKSNLHESLSYKGYYLPDQQGGMKLNKTKTKKRLHNNKIKIKFSTKTKKNRKHKKSRIITKNKSKKNKKHLKQKITKNKTVKNKKYLKSKFSKSKTLKNKKHLKTKNI